MTRSTLISLATFAFLALTGCQTSGVGDPCVPQAIPAGGFGAKDIVIETTSVMCRTRVCLVYQFEGDPTHEVLPDGTNTCDLDGKTPDGTPTMIPTADDPLCATRQDIRDHVYCSCRCGASAANSNVPLCDCPSGFSCTPLQEGGGPGVEGSYCVRGVTSDGG